MTRKTTRTKSKQRTTVSNMAKAAAKLTPEQARKVKGGAESTNSPAGGNDSIWIDLGYPGRTGSKK